ncbi:MAG: MBL fold metallo-hydrolase [Candidatus Zixiibacteriota bacterium]
MKVNVVVVGPFQVNCYLYWDEDSGDGVIIDPGDEADLIEEAVTTSGFNPRGILLTHGHGDHIAALADVKELYDVPVYVGRGEEELLKSPSANVSALVGQPIVAPPPDELLDDEDVITCGSIRLAVLSTPGHTAAGVCYLDESAGWLFCGDTLFCGSIGRTDFPGGSYDTLISSIESKILKLPDSIVCFPGHGPRTTVGAERIGNPFLQGGQFA